VTSGDRALFNGDWDLAMMEYQAAADATSDPALESAAFLGIARVLNQSGIPDQALAILRQILTDFPQAANLAEVHFELARTYEGLQRYAEAADSYRQYLFLRPGVIDFYVNDFLGDSLANAGDLQGALLAYQSAVQAPHLSGEFQVEQKIAQTFAAAGDYQTALALYQEIANQTGNDYTKARMDLLSGQAYFAMGDPDSAYQVFLHAVENYPLSYDSYSALVALVEAGIPVNELDRGLVDYYAGQYGVAIAAFDRFLSAASPEDQVATARYYRGLALRALRDYPAALEEWERVIQGYPGDALWDEAWEQKAYTQWGFLDAYPQAVETLLAFVATSPDHPRAAEFLYDAARVREREGSLELAAALWGRVGDEYPLSGQAFDAVYLSGITRYRLGQVDLARTAFRRSLELAVSPDQRAAGELWIGKCELAQGEQIAARAAWERAAVADPTGYYSERARDLLLERGPFEPPEAFDLSYDPVYERLQAETWLRTTFSIPPEEDLNSLGVLATDPRIQRGRELWRLGLYTEARVEYEDLRLAVSGNAADTYRLANYLVDLGLYRSAIFAARQVLDLAGFDDAGTLTAPLHFNRIRFGTYFSDLVMPIAQAYEFHPLMLFSVIRQESLFESFVRSSAGARGLMQIIPSTGQGIFELNGWPPNYDSEDLYRPKVNVTFGADYLDDQLRFFEGDFYAALAAYNGGPGNSNAWKQLAPQDPDLFLEVVRFGETRLYIKRIYENFAIYRRLYDRTP
jgi:soluble lytic murein transglycosylase